MLLDDVGGIVDSVALPGEGAKDGTETYATFGGEHE